MLDWSCFHIPLLICSVICPTAAHAMQVEEHYPAPQLLMSGACRPFCSRWCSSGSSTSTTHPVSPPQQRQLPGKHQYLLHLGLGSSGTAIPLLSRTTFPNAYAGLPVTSTHICPLSKPYLESPMHHHVGQGMGLMRLRWPQSCGCMVGFKPGMCRDPAFLRSSRGSRVCARGQEGCCREAVPGCFALAPVASSDHLVLPVMWKSHAYAHACEPLHRAVLLCHISTTYQYTQL